jgi:hypothetical protein
MCVLNRCHRYHRRQHVLRDDCRSVAEPPPPPPPSVRYDEARNAAVLGGRMGGGRSWGREQVSHGLLPPKSPSAVVPGAARQSTTSSSSSSSSSSLAEMKARLSEMESRARAKELAAAAGTTLETPVRKGMAHGCDFWVCVGVAEARPWHGMAGDVALHHERGGEFRRRSASHHRLNVEQRRGRVSSRGSRSLSSSPVSGHAMDAQPSVARPAPPPLSAVAPMQGSPPSPSSFSSPAVTVARRPPPPPTAARHHVSAALLQRALIRLGRLRTASCFYSWWRDCVSAPSPSFARPRLD